MEASKHADPKNGTSNPVAAAGNPSSCKTDNGHVKCLDGSSNQLSSVDGVTASESKLESASSKVSADAVERPSTVSFNDPSNGIGDGKVKATPKPKIRIKLKLSPKRDSPKDMKLTNEDDSNGKSSTQETSAPQSDNVDGEDEGDWLCLKCINNNESKRIRCWNCKGWRVSFLFDVWVVT